MDHLPAVVPQPSKIVVLSVRAFRSSSLDSGRLLFPGYPVDSMLNCGRGDPFCEHSRSAVVSSWRACRLIPGQPAIVRHCRVTTFQGSTKRKAYKSASLSSNRSRMGFPASRPTSVPCFQDTGTSSLSTYRSGQLDNSYPGITLPSAC